MAVINLLDRRVAELIAAGEVVERPASIAKELCENSIDAGATSVTVEIRRGGVTYLRVTDNGCGIEGQQVPKAFLRHATSKVSRAEDLESILTLGFRGEALASVAAMCRVELLTRTPSETMGSRYAIEGGEEIAFEEAGCPVGTTIVVRDIFYNTPARMKFLKKDVTEGNSVAGLVDKLALSHPEVAFRFIRDGEQKLQSPGDGRLLSAIHAVCGRDFAAGLLPVDYQSPAGLRLTGYISRPERAKATRTQQSFFINNRFIRSRTCAAALEEAYRHSVMTGRFPCCVLNLEMSTQAVDVNVHPAKTEVRFADEKAVFDLVYYGCKTALSGLGNVTPASVIQTPPAPKARPVRADEGGAERPLAAMDTPPALRDAPGEPSARPAPLDEDLWRFRPAPRIPKREAPPTASARPAAPAAIPDSPAVEAGAPGEGGTATLLSAPELRQVGELFDTYILLEGQGELILVDKHAAHERLLYNRLKAEAAEGSRQLLLAPVTVALEKELYGAAVEQLEVYERLGFLAEDFGDGALLIREVPVELDKADVAALAEEIAEKLSAHSRELTPQALDELYHSIACRSAIKGGNRQSSRELAELVRMVGEDPTLRNCPHGRPVAIALTRRELEKRFGRA